MPDERKTPAVRSTDRYQNRRAELHRMPVVQRIAAIEHELSKLAKTPTSAVVFHRKKLLRMRDDARLEAGLTTPDQLQRENDPFRKLDFSKARIAWRPRVRA